MVKDKGRGKQVRKNENNGLGRSKSKEMGVILILENLDFLCAMDSTDFSAAAQKPLFLFLARGHTL